MSLKAKVEAVIYASEDPVTLPQLVSLLGEEAQAELDAAEQNGAQLTLPGTATPTVEATPQPEEPPAAPDPSQPAPDTSANLAEQRTRDRQLREHMRSVLDILIADYRDNDRGLEIREIANGFRFATKPEYHDAVRGFVRSLKPPLKLTHQALETLAVVAYKQPVTAPEISEIRGVDSAGVLGSLLTRKLVTTAGRKQVIGRPILYKTTKEFLLRFGLKDTSELPSIEEFERLASDLTEPVLTEAIPTEAIPTEAIHEEIPMPPERLDQLTPAPTVGDAPRNLEPMRNIHAAQPDGIPNLETDAEHLTPPPDGPGEFTGDESVPPADNVEVDGRISGVPPTYDQPADDAIDSPALDAEIQADEQTETAP